MMGLLDALPHLVADAARSMQAETGSQDTLELAARLAVEIVDGAEAASVSIVESARTVQTPAATAEWARRADEIQYELGEGPCLSAVWDEEVVSCPDLVAEDRWGTWASRTVKETDIQSMLSFRMFTQTSRVGALNLYATRPHAFNGTDLERGISLAAHAAIALASARHTENMDIALDSRSLIGQATGIIMAHYDIDAVRGFAVLKRISQETNTKLHEVAAEVVRTRRLPT